MYPAGQLADTHNAASLADAAALSDFDAVADLHVMIVAHR